MLYLPIIASKCVHKWEQFLMNYTVQQALDQTTYYPQRSINKWLMDEIDF
jgi:hypothetical protein